MMEKLLKRKSIYEQIPSHKHHHWIAFSIALRGICKSSRAKNGMWMKCRKLNCLSSSPTLFHPQSKLFIIIKLMTQFFFAANECENDSISISPVKWDFNSGSISYRRKTFSFLAAAAFWRDVSISCLSISLSWIVSLPFPFFLPFIHIILYSA